LSGFHSAHSILSQRVLVRLLAAFTLLLMNCGKTSRTPPNSTSNTSDIASMTLR